MTPAPPRPSPARGGGNCCAKRGRVYCVLEGQRDRAADGGAVDDAAGEPEVGAIVREGRAERSAAVLALRADTVELPVDEKALVGAAAESAELADRPMPWRERPVDRVRPTVDHRVESEAATGDVRRMMAQVLMLDVDVPGPGETSSGLADELALGRRRVGQFTTVDPLRIGAAGRCGDGQHQAGT